MVLPDTFSDSTNRYPAFPPKDLTQLGPSKPPAPPAAPNTSNWNRPSPAGTVSELAPSEGL